MARRPLWLGGENYVMQSQKRKVFTLDSLDGEIGKVKEFSFDDQHLAIRYLVADTGNWTRPGRFIIY